MPNKPRDLSDLRVLVAEDNDVNRLVAIKYLKRWGISPDMAKNGLEALKAAAISLYDVILMDLQMPEMDGYQAASQIRKLAGCEEGRLTIIALTAGTADEVAEAVKAAGMDTCIIKPFNPEELHQKLVFYSTSQPRK